jgi:hypothetical protein
MDAVWRRIAYTYTSLEDEVRICIMSIYSAVVKSKYPLGSSDERGLTERHAACYALTMPQALRVQQHGQSYTGCYYSDFST